MTWTIRGVCGMLLAGLAGIALAEGAPTVPPLPRGVSSQGAVVCDGWLYVYGGHCGKTHTYSTETVSGQFHRVNLNQSAKWEELPGGPILQGMNLVTHGGKVYRVGGMQPRNAPGEKADNHSVAEVACFDPATKKWSSLPPLPEARSSHDVVVLGDTLYVVGGWTMSGRGNSKWINTMATLDLSNPKAQWKNVPQPFQRRALTAAAHDGKVYVMGGLTENTSTERLVNIYDPKSGKWTTGPTFPLPGRNGFSPAACSVAGKLYLAVSDGTVYVLNEKDSTWDRAKEMKTGRIVGRLVSAGKNLYMVGGATKEGNATEVEVLTLSESK
jgi:N-acetylneuraminic acid mutarotase